MKFIFNNREYPSIDGVKKAYYGIPVPPGPDYTEPFYIQDLSGSGNTVQITKFSSSYSPTITIEKSLDGKNWTSMGSTSTTAITASIPANGKLYLRCNTASWAGTNAFSHNSIKATGSHKVGGNIMSLLYGINFTGDETTFPSGSSRTVFSLFQKDTYLIDASELLLPATTLTNYCYQSMFSGCTSLTTAPLLPATTLADGCYSNMFQSCTSLTTAPALPATTLANSCYQSMFSACKKLTTAPALPATTLAEYCYQSMFSDCTSLTTAPTLPATTLADYCYQYMFQSCTSLTTVPTLPATTLTDGCYFGMFSGCASLTTAPTLPATTLAYMCYAQMFYGCTSLTTAPTLPATTLTDSCYFCMFSDCTSLNSIKCLAIDIMSTYGCLDFWVDNVSPTGTFTKVAGVEWPDGESGIPYDWIVVEV